MDVGGQIRRGERRAFAPQARIVGCVGEEAVVEVATLEDEVDQAIECVPDEENAEFGRDGLLEEQ